MTEKNREEIQYQYARAKNLQTDFVGKGKKFTLAFIDLVESYNRLTKQLVSIQRVHRIEHEVHAEEV